MRRLIIQEPVTRFAIWSPRFAWFSVAVVAIGVLLLRIGRVDAAGGFAVLMAGFLIAVIGLGLAVAAFTMIWTEGRRGIASAAWGFALSAAVLAGPAVLATRAVLLPRLADISTDIDMPPGFSRSRAALAARAGHVPPDVPPDDRQEQREAYPLVVPLYLDLAPDDAFDVARKAAQALGWQVIEADKPGGRIGTGRIDAIDHSLLLNLPSDITVRLRPRADGTRIDVRAATRFGKHDLGANAARIARYLDEVSSLAAVHGST